jgi:REP element-mobilizing transposase RayT
MPEPLAYFLTWSTYGAWLPGDARGWIEYRHGWKLPDPIRELEAAARMTEDACRLTPEQRAIVEAQVAETCRFRGWELFAVNCRSNHIHVVVAADRHPKIVRNHLKAWCTRRLKEHAAATRTRIASEVRTPTRNVSEVHTPTRYVSEVRTPTPNVREAANEAIRENWWAERGSQRYVNDHDSLESAIIYVLDGQDYSPDTNPKRQ